jgi:hypothetical protein
MRKMRVIPSRSTDPETSHRGEKDVAMRADSQKYKLLAAYETYGEMIPDQARRLAGISARSCYWKRCSELHLDMSFLEDTGKVAKGDSGSDQAVLAITPRGESYLRKIRSS